MARDRKIPRSSGAASVHAVNRLINQCGFNGNAEEAKRFINLCRKKAGKNGSLIISAENLDVSRKQMLRWNIQDNKFYVVFVWGKAPTVLKLLEKLEK